MTRSVLPADAEATLASWHPPDAGQARLRDEFLRLLAARPDGCSRSCHPDHLTASALIISADHERVALTLHAKLGLWLQTGGHLEPGDASLRDGAAREAREESGLAGLAVDPEPLLLSSHEVPCGPLRPARHLDVQFLALTTGDETLIRSAESNDLAWFHVDALPTETDCTVRQLVSAAMRRVSQGPR